MISSTLSGLTGAPDANSANAAPNAGPVMSGVFQGAGNWRLDFVDGGVLVNCASLSPNQESYSLSLANNRATLTIKTTPRPLVLTVHPDGAITGPPGPVTINGVVASGYVSGTAGTGATQKDQYGNLYNAAGQRVAGNANTPGYSTFSPRTATCPAISLTKGSGAGIQTMETNLLKSAFGGDTGPATPAGIRMQGIFASASTGFSAQFFPESVLLGCGPDAARAYPYTVIADGTKSVVSVAAPDKPLNLAFRADGSLDAGTGPYQVHGRIVTGQDDNDNFTFAPMERSCNLAVLTPSKTIPTAAGTAGVAIATASAGVATPDKPLGNATLDRHLRSPRLAQSARQPPLRPAARYLCQLSQQSRHHRTRWPIPLSIRRPRLCSTAAHRGLPEHPRRHQLFGRFCRPRRRHRQRRLSRRPARHLLPDDLWRREQPASRLGPGRNAPCRGQHPHA